MFDFDQLGKTRAEALTMVLKRLNLNRITAAGKMTFVIPRTEKHMLLLLVAYENRPRTLGDTYFELHLSDNREVLDEFSCRINA